MASESEADSPVVYNSSIPADILEDLCSRFLINIPDEERKDVVRLCFQIELAHWFYIDFHRQENPDLPGCGIKEFTRIIFNHFPFLNKSDEDINQIFANWRKYKLKVPVFGAIIVNESLDKCILVQPAMSKTSWGFPKGKVNKDEDEFDCAIREVYEETGFDMRKYADPNDYIERKIHDHPIRLYVVPGVPDNTQFKPQTRGEIRDIRWFQIDHLPAHKKDTVCTEYLNCNPSNFFMVIPFVKDLRRRLAPNKTPRPSSQNSMSNREEIDSPVKLQLQKLVDKEDARLESERKQAAAERRRKAQQEKFIAQHALTHPLRDHHQREQERLRTARGYQSPTGDWESRYSRGSPLLKQQDEPQPTIKILQRPERERKTPQETRDKTGQHPMSRDYKTSNVSRSLDYLQDSPLHKLLHGTGDHNLGPSLGVAPFSPIHHTSPYGTAPSHPTTRYFSHHSELWKQDNTAISRDQSLDPLTKLRLLSASAATAHHTKLKTAVQENSTDKEGQFLFSAPAFTNFTFNRKPILATLDPS